MWYLPISERLARKLTFQLMKPNFMVEMQTWSTLESLDMDEKIENEPDHLWIIFIIFQMKRNLKLISFCFKLGRFSFFILDSV